MACGTGYLRSSASTSRPSTSSGWTTFGSSSSKASDKNKPSHTDVKDAYDTNYLRSSASSSRPSTSTMSCDSKATDKNGNEPSDAPSSRLTQNMTIEEYVPQFVTTSKKNMRNIPIYIPTKITKPIQEEEEESDLVSEETLKRWQVYANIELTPKQKELLKKLITVYMARNVASSVTPVHKYIGDSVLTRTFTNYEQQDPLASTSYDWMCLFMAKFDYVSFGIDTGQFRTTKSRGSERSTDSDEPEKKRTLVSPYEGIESIEYVKDMDWDTINYQKCPICGQDSSDIIFYPGHPERAIYEIDALMEFNSVCIVNQERPEYIVSLLN